MELSAKGSGPTRRVRFFLWGMAFVVMATAVVYQRRTGPTYPERGSAVLGGAAVDYRLLRSHVSSGDAPVEIAAPEGTEGTLRWRRLRSDDDWHRLPLRREGALLRSALPAQPPAGKVEYLLELTTPGGPATVPPDGVPVVLRFKGDVPVYWLLPHVLCMFVGLLVGVRAGLGALFSPVGVTRIARVAFGGITLGGMILGPIVQKHAFGAYWTGWPFGQDLTDNKTLWMWLAWLLACVALGRGVSERRPWRRALVVLSTVITLAVYLVPHSLRGSELDYRSLEQGVAAPEAIRTGG